MRGQSAAKISWLNWNWKKLYSRVFVRIVCLFFVHHDKNQSMISLYSFFYHSLAVGGEMKYWNGTRDAIISRLLYYCYTLTRNETILLLNRSRSSFSIVSFTKRSALFLSFLYVFLLLFCSFLNIRYSTPRKLTS